MLNVVGVRGLQITPPSIKSLSLLDSVIDVAARILQPYNGSLWVTDPSQMFLNSGGAGLVNTGDAVGYIRDVLNNRPASQSTASRRPVLQYASNKWGLQFDGTDDALTTATLPTASAETFGVVYTPPVTAASAQYPISRRNATAAVGSTLYTNSTTFSVNFINAGSAVAAGAVIAAGVTGVVSAVGKVGSIAVRVNGVDGTAITYSAYVSGTNTLVLGNSTDFTRAFGGTLHAAYYAPVEISSTDRQLLDRLLGSLFGVDL